MRHLRLLLIPLALLLTWAAVPQPRAQAQAVACWVDTFEEQIIDLGPINPDDLPVDPLLLGLFGIRIENGQLIQRRGTGSDFNDSCADVGDNRINAADQSSEAAIYCTPTGIEVYDINLQSQGTLVLTVTLEQIFSVPPQPEVNTLIAEAGGFAVYRLTNGNFQLNAPPDWEGKSYTFEWESC